MAARWHQRVHCGRLSPIVLLMSSVVLLGGVAGLRWIIELVANSGRALDASDESYYLLSVQYPHSSRLMVTGFDSYLAPIWWLCGGSIARYRIAGMLVLLAVLTATVRLCNRKFSTVPGVPLALGTAAVVVVVASLTFTYYVLWITTPGYNFVVLAVALLVAGMTTSLALAPDSVPQSGSRISRTPLEAALGFVLSVALFVKAPAFAFLLVLSSVAVVIARGSRGLVRRGLRLAAGFAGGLLLFVLLTGTPSEIASSITRGVHANRILGGHTPASLWELTAMRTVYGPWFLRYLVGAATLALLWRLIRRDNTRLLLTAVGSIVTAIVFSRALPRGGVAALGSGTGWWWMRMAAMMILWSTANVQARSRQLAVGPLVALMAIGATAGSNNGVVHEVALTVGVLGIGLFVHGLVVLSLRGETCGTGRWPPSVALALLPIVLFFLLGSLASMRALRGALADPYRLNDTLHAESEPVDLGVFGTIDVHPETAEYVRELQAIAQQVPAEARDCLVDLSGGTPLSAMALGARPAAAPWILGGYTGSDNFADYVLSGSPCLSGPYILIEAPHGTGSVDLPKWLDTAGARFLGRVRYRGYKTEDQLVWLIPVHERDAVASGN